MKNEIVKKMPAGDRPSYQCVCIDCLHAHWHTNEVNKTECKCRLLTAIVWNGARGNHNITACTGSETLEMKRIPKPPCKTCKYAVWYKDRDELQGYCRDIYRKIYGKAPNGYTISTIAECNSYEEMEVL